MYRNVNSKSQKLSSLSKNGGNSTFCILTLTALQIKGLRLQTADPNETAHNEPPQQDLYCLPFCFWRLTHTSVWNKGSDQIQKWKSSLLKLKAERVESPCKVYGSVSPIIKEILFFSYPLRWKRFLIFNPFTSEFLKWANPSLNLDSPIVSNRDFH